MGNILVGISAWTEPTLIESGRFYPATARSAEARLKFYASQFQIVEVDSTYYALPAEKTAGLWVERTPDNFLFDVKAFRLFTQHPATPEVLPKDIRDRLPWDLRGRRNFYLRDLSEGTRKEIWDRFEQALLPLDSAGKLGTVLFQFPPWFLAGEEQREYIAFCKKKLPQYRLAIEFRHSSWMSEKNRDRTEAFLWEQQLPYVCVDEPQGFDSSVPPVTAVTSDISVIRFHGRNQQSWEKDNPNASGRFNYLYSQEELAEWKPRVRELASDTRQLHVIFNNCYDDKAIVNARQIRQMLD
jgi:uncharacterized protein YecE (DUF72 family)